MPYIRVKQKYQVTIPAKVREVVGVHEGDTLEAKAENGNIVLIPQTIHERRTIGKKGLSAMIGSGEHCRSFQSMEEADRFISKLRDEWN